MSDTAKSKAGLVALVVTYNRLDKLRETIDRLLQVPADVLAEIVVQDNASTDGTADWLAMLNTPRISVNRSEHNIGGAGGFEQGLRHVTATLDPDWVVLMDDDARPEPGTLEAFAHKDRSASDAWAAAVYHPDGRICDMNRPSINPFWHKEVLRRTVLGGGRDGFHLTRADYESAETRDIDGTSFVGFFISREGIRRAGFPDGDLFLYRDDVLYTLGLRRAGGRIMFDPGLRFEHDFSTMTDEDRRFRPLWKTYYHYRNLLFVYRLCSGIWFTLVLPAAAGKWLLKARHHDGERLAFIGLVLRAVRDGVLNRTKVSHQTVLRWSRQD